MKPTWDQWFLNIAETVSTRSSCQRSKVGAVIADKDRRIVSVGYNDSTAGRPGCEQCPRRLSNALPGESSYDDPATRCNALHAEQNALLYARRSLVDCTIYITRSPCHTCSVLIEGAGIKNVIYKGD